jgi:hypothetical protein
VASGWLARPYDGKAVAKGGGGGPRSGPAGLGLGLIWAASGGRPRCIWSASGEGAGFVSPDVLRRASWWVPRSGVLDSSGCEAAAGSVCGVELRFTSVLRL